MAFYEVNQYELYFQTHRVEAESEADAIAKVLNGDSEWMADRLEYVGPDIKNGIWVDQNQELVDSIRLYDPSIFIGKTVIPSIRSVEKVE